MENKERPVLVAVIGTLGVIIAALISSGYLKSNSAAKREESLEAKVQYLEEELGKRDKEVANLRKKFVSSTEPNSPGFPKTGPAGVSSDTPSGNSTAPTVASFERDNFKFDFHGCLVSGAVINCSFTITNQGLDRALGFSCGNQQLFDDAGNEYKASLVRIANSESEYFIRAKQLIAGVPTPAYAAFSSVSGKRISLLSIKLTNDGQELGFQLRDVPLQN